MSLETMQPDPEWEASGVTAAIDVVREASNLTIRVWGGDWCGDCQDVLPGLAASLEAAGVDRAAIIEYPVEKNEAGEKIGPDMDAHGVEFIPTVVIERDGREVARFVESAPVAPIVHLADQLATADAN